jgi:RNA polymerase sigma-70 factor (ECF subfamily)
MPEENATNSTERTNLVQGLFIQHAAQLRGFIVALTPDLGQVDDLFQETFLTVTAKAGVFDPQRDFLAWACGIARYKVMEAGRRAARQWQPLSDGVLETLCACEPPQTPREPLLQHLTECLKELTPQSQRMMEMCYQQGHKPGEIARRLAWTPEAVYVALSRARAAMRQCVERKTAGEGGRA